MGSFDLFMKRTFDITVSLVTLLLFLPLLVPIIIALRLTGEGYVFYKQERIGQFNRPFFIYKFATMLKDSPNMAGGIITTAKDPRMTPLGPFLRSTKINEIPQLLNILLGQMSLVGPRPVMKKSFDQYPEEVKSVIYNLPPGLTGIGSIIFSNEEQLITDVKERGEDVWEFYVNQIYPYKGELEMWYQKNVSFSTDNKILFLTLYSIFNEDKSLIYKSFKTLPRPAYMMATA
ncbi:sugar transferase [Litoribacter alkaliphilus]|uniref:Sugar transferase n=2 Tax=Litoribacter ruber TaxID=702568 RepID=A0AAP2G4B2_9BACT|nr:sugar transferase [Litoribacter alkaliphilus]